MISVGDVLSEFWTSFFHLPTVDTSVTVIMVMPGSLPTVDTSVTVIMVMPGSLPTVVEIRAVVDSTHRVLLASNTHCDMCVPLEMQSMNMKPTEKQQIITDAHSVRMFNYQLFFIMFSLTTGRYRLFLGDSTDVIAD